MQTRLIMRAVFMLMLTAPFAAQASLLNTKPGEWKETVTTSVTLPGQHASSKPQTRIKHECQKASASTQTLFHSLRQIGCKVKVLHQSAHMVDFTLACPSPDKANALQHIHIRMQALSATHATGTMSKTFPDGKQVHAKSDTHWVSATCTPQ